VDEAQVAKAFEELDAFTGRELMASELIEHDDELLRTGTYSYASFDAHANPYARTPHRRKLYILPYQAVVPPSMIILDPVYILSALIRPPSRTFSPCNCLLN
jgi:hypothetical protein